MRRPSAAFAILAGGLIAGSIDITYAVGFSALRGVSPLRILQSVASGLLGSPAYQGGAATAALGLLLHFVLMLIIAAIFYFAGTRLRFLVARPVWWGALYGVRRVSIAAPPNRRRQLVRPGEFHAQGSCWRADANCDRQHWRRAGRERIIRASAITWSRGLR